MAKSTRSKVKRHFRAKKRTEGIYAAVEAARINRLHNKLKALTTKGDEQEEEVVSSFGDEGEDQMRGWFNVLGLIDPGDLSAESMDGLSEIFLAVGGQEPNYRARSVNIGEYGVHISREEGQDMFDHLFIEPCDAHGTR